MIDPPKPDLAKAIADAMAWWREAGVDCDFGDVPTRWLASTEKEAPTQPRPRAGGGLGRPGGSSAADRGPRLRGDAESAATAAAPAPPAIAPGAWPQDLAAFTAWWLSEPALDDGRISGRVPPRGRQGAELMVIVPDPEREDREHLLSGPQGRLLDAMLAAMGVAPGDVYVASVLPRHMPMPDWSALSEKGFGALLRHHVKLVTPEKLLVLGGNISPLLSNDPAHNHPVLLSFNQQDLTIPVLIGKSLAALLERPRWKAGLWQGWLDWTGGRSGRG